jgi:hypothetical protein
MTGDQAAEVGAGEKAPGPIGLSPEPGPIAALGGGGPLRCSGGGGVLGPPYPGPE